MKVRKNLEGLFLVAAFIGVSASYASAETVVALAAQVASVAAPAIPTVTVVGHRLSAAEKASLN